MKGDFMAYQGYLVKVGNYVIPKNFINAKTYVGNRNVQDIDSYRDASGKLHREAVAHVPCKAEFETQKMTSSEFAGVMGNIKGNFTNSLERKASVTVFIPEEDGYITQDMYMPDIKPTIDSEINGELLYEPVRLAFIGY